MTRGRYRQIQDDGDLGRAINNTDVYRVRTETSYRRFIPKEIPTRFWRRTWQAEWPGCKRAVRAFTRHGALTKAAKAQLAEGVA